MASKRRAIMTKFDEEASDLAPVGNHMRVYCFQRAGLLIDCTKSDSDEKINFKASL